MKPAQRASEIIKYFGFEKPSEIVIEEIANAKAAIIEEAELNGPLGQIYLTGDFALIKIEKSIRESGQRRFTEAHELGHYVIESVNGKFLSFLCTAEDINSFLSNKKRESDANEFASELLMPREWFLKFINRKEVSFDLIKECSSHFEISLTAAAFKYATIGIVPTALIMSEKGKVKWSISNNYFPFKYIEKGVSINKNTPVYSIFQKEEYNPEKTLIPASAWFSDDYNCKQTTYLYEQNVYMKNYNSVLTLLWESEFE